MAGDRKDPKIAYQLLLCPVVDIAHLDTESYALFGDGPWLSKANIEITTISTYAGRREDPMLTRLRSSQRTFVICPRAYCDRRVRRSQGRGRSLRGETAGTGQ